MKTKLQKISMALGLMMAMFTFAPVDTADAKAKRRCTNVLTVTNYTGKTIKVVKVRQKRKGKEYKKIDKKSRELKNGKSGRYRMKKGICGQYRWRVQYRCKGRKNRTSIESDNSNSENKTINIYKCK